MHRRALLLILRRLAWAALALLALLLPLGAAAQSGCTALWATVDNDGPGGGTTQSLRYFNASASRWDNLSPQVNLTGNANALAGNPVNGLLYYVDRTASVGDLYSFNINSRTNSLVGRIPVTNGPPAGNIIGATFDATGRLFIYGTNGGNEYIAEVNTTPATTLTLTIPWTTVTLVGTGANPALGGSGDIYVDQSGNGFIASNTVPNSIWSLDLTAGANFGRVAQVLTLSPGSATSLAGVAVDPITGATYVSTGNAGSVTYLVNTTTGATTLLDNTTSYTVSDMGNCVNSPAAPSLTKSFSTAYQSGSTGTATVLLTVGNPNIVPIWLTSNLVDMLPSGMTVHTMPALAGSCTTVSGNSVTATAGAGNVTFASGGSIPAGGCTLSFVVSAGVALGEYVNTLPAGSLTTSAGNNATAASAIFKVGTDFSASKTQGLGTAGPYGAGSLTVPGGSTMQYVLTITNSASGGTGSASFTDTLPELVAPVLGISAAMTGGGSCTTATAVVGAQTQITGTVNNAPPGAVCTVTITAQVSGTQTSAVSFINTLTLAPLSGTGDANASNNVATVSTSITPEADLRVTKLSSAASGETGGTLSYAIVLQNAGPSLAGNVTVTDVLPAGLTLVGASVSPSGSLTLVTSTAGVTATAPWLGVGSTTVTVVVSLSNLGSADAVVTNTASATSTTPDPTPTNNTGTVSTTLTPRADLVMAKSGPASAPAGGTFGYVIAVANAGPSTAANVTVTDVLPAGLVLLSASSTLGSVSSNAAGLTVTIPTLGVATTVTVSLTVQIDTTATGSIANTAGVTSTTSDPTPGNNTGTAVINVAFADLTTAVDLPASAPAGSVVTVTVTFTNSAVGATASTASAVVGTVTLSNGQVQTYTLGQLAPGASVSQVFTTTVPAGGSTTLNATATVVTSTPELNTANNVATDTMAVGLLPNATLSGRVWLDVDGDKRYTAGRDRDVADWRVDLMKGGVLTGTAATSQDGRYSIPGQVPGVGYSVVFRNPVGNAIFSTPYNQTVTTASGNLSTGTSTAVATGTLVAGAINQVTLYAGDNVREQNLPVDPSGLIYDSVTRLPVSGVSVTLIGPSGIPVPSSHVVQGVNSIVTDPTGVYQFDLIPGVAVPGRYRLQLAAPPGYSALPAVLGGVAPAQGVQMVPPATFPGENLAVTTTPGNLNVPPAGTGLPATRYVLELDFINLGAAPFGSMGVVRNQIPIDAIGSAPLRVTKTGNKAVAEMGDSVLYTVRVSNPNTGVIPAVTLEDQLPEGFRYILGTARLGGARLSDPAGGVGSRLGFSMGSLPAGGVVELTYFVRLGAGSAQGDGVNRASAVFQSGGVQVRSNTAQYKVNVQGGVFSNEGCIVGKVYADCDANHVQNNASGSRELGIPGVRLVMLDGSYVITDSEGKYSLCGVKSQTHVLKVDRSTLPRGARLVPSSNRNAGVGDSLFIDLKGGELARADFIEGSCTPEVLDQIKARRAQGGVESVDNEKGRPLKIDNSLGGVQQQILPRPRLADPLPALPAGGVR